MALRECVGDARQQGFEIGLLADDVDAVAEALAKTLGSRDRSPAGRVPLAPNAAASASTRRQISFGIHEAWIWS